MLQKIFLYLGRAGPEPDPQLLPEYRSAPRTDHRVHLVSALK